MRSWLGSLREDALDSRFQGQFTGVNHATKAGWTTGRVLVAESAHERGVRPRLPTTDKPRLPRRVQLAIPRPVIRRPKMVELPRPIRRLEVEIHLHPAPVRRPRILPRPLMLVDAERVCSPPRAAPRMVGEPPLRMSVCYGWREER
jgi:hypothetical protein